MAAAVVGVGTSQLLSIFLSPTADVMNLLPEPLKNWGMQEFGTSASLFFSLMALEIVAGVAAVAAICKRSRILQGSFLVVGAAVCAAVLARPEARLTDILPTLVGVASAVGVLRLLTFGPGTNGAVQAYAVDRGRRHSLMTLGFATAGLAGGVVGAISTRSSANPSDLGAPVRGAASPQGGADSTPLGRAGIAAKDASTMENPVALGKTVFVEDFRDGARTDNEIIAAAFDALEAGGEIRFGQGVTYVLSRDLDFVITNKPNVLIDGQGAVLDGSSGASRLLRLQGSKDISTPLATLKAEITRRTKTLKVTSSAGYLAGDMITIRSDGELFNFDGASPLNAFKQELARVAEVPDGTTILLEERTWNTYSTNGYTVTLERYVTAKNLTVRNLNLVGVRSANAADYSAKQYGLWVRYFDGVTVENVKVFGTTSAGIVGQEGINFTAIDCRAEDVNRSPGGGGVSLYARECHVAKFIDCYVKGGRHAIDVDRARDILYSGCTAEGTGAAAFSTHGNCDVAKIVDCTARECGGGIIVRGRNTIVSGNHILGSKLPAEQDVAQSYVHGIIVGHGHPNVYGRGNGGIDLIVDNNFVDIAGPDFSRRADIRASGIHVSAALVNSRIVNNTIRGFPWHGIACVGDYNTGTEISGNFIDCSSQLAGEPGSGISLSPDHSGSTQSNIAIDRNVIKPGSAHSGIRFAGGDNGSSGPEHIRIRYNQIGACGTAPIYLGDGGRFGPDIVIFGNETDNVNAVDFGSSTFASKPYIGMHGYGQGPHPLGIGQEAGSRMRPGLYYGSAGSAITSLTATLNRMSAVPLFVPQRVAIDRIGVTIVTASDTVGSEGLLAIYEDVKDGYGGYPGDLVPGSVGIVATDSPGYKEDAGLAVTLNPGLYWLAFVAQTAAPEVTVVSGSNPMVGNVSSAIANRCGYVQNAVDGKLPSTFSTSVSSQSGLPLVQVHIAS